MTVSSILDVPQKTLTPYLWNDAGAPMPTLKPQIKKWLQSVIYDELEKYHSEPHTWANLVLTGSLTTYQFGPTSDCDVSVFISPNFLPEWDRSLLIGMMVKDIDGKKVAGTPYPLQVFIVSPKVTKEMLYQPMLRSGYDLDTDTWIVPPEPNRVHDVAKEYNAWYVYALETLDKLNNLLKYNPTQAKEYWAYIHRRRREEETAGKGDYGIFNIIFKMIERNSGLVGRLKSLEPKQNPQNLEHESLWRMGQL